MLAAIIGLVAMHQLAGGVNAGGDRHTSAFAHSTSQGDRPDAPHGSPGQVCQLTAPAAGPNVAAAPELFSVPGELPPTAGPPVSPQTAAPEAADGTGCGPPSLTELSRFLT